MKVIVKMVNGYEIKFDGREDNTNVNPYSIKYGSKKTEVLCFRTLKAAEKWANIH